MEHFDDPEVRREYEAYLAEQAEAGVRRLLPAEQRLQRTFDQIEHGLREIETHMRETVAAKLDQAQIHIDEVLEEAMSDPKSLGQTLQQSGVTMEEPKAEPVYQLTAEEKQAILAIDTPKHDRSELGQLAAQGKPETTQGDSPFKGKTPDEATREASYQAKPTKAQGASVDDSAGRSRFDTYSRDVRTEKQKER